MQLSFPASSCSQFPASNTQILSHWQSVNLPVRTHSGTCTTRLFKETLDSRVTGCGPTAEIADTRPALQRRTEPLLSITNQTTAGSTSLRLYAACSSARQLFTHILWDKKFHHRVQNIPSFVPVFSPGSSIRFP
jgi:hypothetical protein